MEFDLNALAEQLNTSDSTPVQETSPALSQETTETTPVATDKVETVSTPPVDDVIEVDMPDGTKESLKRSELHNHIMRQKDYTRKTQALAAKAKQYEAFEQNAAYIRQQLEFAEQMQQVTQTPDQLFGYLIQQMGPEKAAQAMASLMGANPEKYDPNDIPTFQEADKLLERRLSAYEQRIQETEQRLQQQFEQRIRAERQSLIEERNQLAREKQEEEYASKFKTVMSETLNEFPRLKAIDMGEDLIRFKTAQKIGNYVKVNGEEPPFELAAQWMKDAAKEQVTKLETEFNYQKVNSPLNNGIEPAGGARPVTVNTQPKSHYNNNTGETDWDSLTSELASRIKGATRL